MWPCNVNTKEGPWGQYSKSYAEDPRIAEKCTSTRGPCNIRRDEEWDDSTSKPQDGTCPPLAIILHTEKKWRPPGRRKKVIEYLRTWVWQSWNQPRSSDAQFDVSATVFCLCYFWCFLLIETKNVSLSRKLWRCYYSAFSPRKEVW